MYSIKDLFNNSFMFFRARQIVSPDARGVRSSLAKGFAHGPLSLHPWQIELDFVITADRHLADFTSPTYKDDITFDQWVLVTVSCLGRCKKNVPSVYIFYCIHVMREGTVSETLG